MTVAIEFATEGEAAKINYSIPLPGAHTGRRVTEIDLEFEDEAVQPMALEYGVDLKEAVGTSEGSDGRQVDLAKAASFFSESLSRSGVEVSALALAAARKDEGSPSREPVFALRLMTTRPPVSNLLNVDVTDVEEKLVLNEFDRFREELANGVVRVPGVDWAGRVSFFPRPLDPEVKPRFFLVERYGISSFLGDYGMGRTVKTFTLLPGESTLISLRTWQSSRESVENSSSIIDSHEQSARSRFTDKVQNETTDKATRSSTESWHVEAEVSASWGWGSANVSGGGGGEYHSGREQFSRQAAEATKEHAAEASSKRELSVTSSSERTSEGGAESLIERTITNVNVRRVLNFVFRELNQSYNTKLHLKDISVGFTNGRFNSWREVPLSGLRRLLTETLEPSQADHAAQQILSVAGTVFDRNDAAVQVLERVTISDTGDGITVEPASRDESGEYPPPTETMYYRFRRGPLNQEGASNPVEGVLLNESAITMRTDSVVVEALLGQADALDAYAMEVQEAAASKGTLANERERLILDTLRAIEDPEKRAELGARLLGTCCPQGASDNAG